MNRQLENKIDSVYKKFNILLSNSTKELIELDRLATEIKKVSGYSLEKLLELFLAGYTLKAPQNGYTAMFTIIDEMGDKND